MSAMHARAARRERQAAAALGSTRIRRKRGESAPDIAAVRLPGGAVLGPEVKSRKRLPRLITGALEQARGYFGAAAIPCAVVYELGAGDGIACVPLRAFAGLVGLEVRELPAARPLPRARPAPPSPQLVLPWVG